jgi:hypothetical protein
MPKISDVELDNRFGYHEPAKEKWGLIQAIHDTFLNMARFVRDETPTSREQSSALTALEEAEHYAIAAIVRRSDEGVSGL